MGDTVFSEYSRIRIDGEVPNKVVLEADGRLVDVSAQQWLLCIEPLVFGVWVGNVEGTVDEGGGTKEYRLRFGGGAIVELECMHRVEEEDGVLLLLRVRRCHPMQLNAMRRWVLYYRYYSRDKLSYERFKGFVSAYTYPRRVRIVSFRDEDHYNIFPMDLLGPVVGTNRYVFGLRHTNRTLDRILSAKKIVVCEVSAAYEDLVYQLGKHHSNSPPMPEELPFDVELSRQYGFYFPSWVQEYKEVRIMKTYDMGSHMLLWGEIEGDVQVQGGSDHSYLIHFLQYLHALKKYPYLQK